MTYAFDNSEKKVIAGPIVIDDDEPVTKYQASDGRTFWAYNGMEVFYEDERLYSALDRITELELRERKHEHLWGGTMYSIDESQDAELPE